MNAASIIILSIVAGLVGLALYFATRNGGKTCSCDGCSKKEGCPYCNGEGK